MKAIKPTAVTAAVLVSTNATESIAAWAAGTAYAADDQALLAATQRIYQRIVAGTTLKSGDSGMMPTRKTMEINVQHPIIQALNAKFEEDAEDTKDLALMLLDAAMLQSGFGIDEKTGFNKRMGRVLSAGLGVDPEAQVEEDVVEEEAEEEEEESEEEEEVEEAEDEKKHEEL